MSKQTQQLIDSINKTINDIQFKLAELATQKTAAENQAADAATTKHQYHQARVRDIEREITYWQQQLAKANRDKQTLERRA